ncbi:acyloxyacyl hydrolase [Epibacterium ulvae]|uniref:Lipid A 3-O-deacylase (PagL) n=1 Tax=Epibacterium ulvae TaxID=1156985 RepID=A0A1G5QSW0_9RHOB|nr:acyloxyacyl hydrolase [Epibacterium ulvae]SCZ64658.1 Lipid A 3-O-deacylase (PagL) [Epibacterium ulvae]
MKLTKIQCLAAAVTITLGFGAVAPSTASAQSLVFGAGFADFSAGEADDGAIVSLDYLHTPFWERGALSAGWGATAALTDSGDGFIGGGLAGRYELKNNWFLEGSVMPGAFFENEPENDLGSTFEIRSLIGVGKTLRSGNGISLAISHKSNASTADDNPGLNAITLRWHKPL